MYERGLPFYLTSFPTDFLKFDKLGIFVVYDTLI